MRNLGRSPVTISGSPLLQSRWKVSSVRSAQGRVVVSYEGILFALDAVIAACASIPSVEEGTGTAEISVGSEIVGGEISERGCSAEEEGTDGGIDIRSGSVPSGGRVGSSTELWSRASISSTACVSSVSQKRETGENSFGWC